MEKINPFRLILKNTLLQLLLLILVFPLGSVAQVFWTEAFQNGCATGCLASSYTGPNGTWSLNATGANDPEANRFYISGSECGNAAGSCGSACGATDPSLHIGANDGFVTDNGASYDAGGFCGSFFCVTTDTRAESPFINCTGQTNITLSFNYLEDGDLANDDASLWYFDGTTWTQIDPLAKTLFGACSPQGKWTAFSITLPASANNNSNIKIGFRWVNNDDGIGSDPSFAVDDITLSVLSTNTITTGTITGSPFCACSAISVPFTSTGTFTAGNIYTAQLSDASGSFAAPTSIGTLASTANTGTISATIPCSALTGSGYRIRVVSSAPATTGTDNGVDITINALPVATFSYPGSPYCSTSGNPFPTFSGGGTAGTFTSTAGLVFVNAATGEVNLSASAGGTYTVTNTIPASGGCAAVTDTSTISITQEPNATFTYSGPYCKNDPDPSPTYPTGGTAGTYSAIPAGLVINSSTGVIDLSASTAGTYNVSNSFPPTGPCGGVVFTTPVTINAVPDSTFNYPGSTFCQSGTDPVPVVNTSGGTFTASPAGLVFISTSTGEIDLSASTLGTYSVTYTTPGPCATSSTASITITTTPDATFSYTGTPYCSNAADPFPTYSAGGSAGIFSSTAGLVFVSTSTGQVDLSASTPGTYTVTNSIAASGSCPAATATSTITINTAPDSTFTYSSASYCQTGANPVPTTATSGGNFTSTPAGLVFVSATTGEIDLAGSSVGSYSITYTTPGSCPSSMTSTVSIVSPPDASFSYTGSPFCQNDPNPSPVFTGTATAGTFGSTAGLSFVSTSTGEVNLAGSSPGTYTVTNTIAASGNCPASTAIATITIDSVPVVTVNSAVICSGQSATLNASGANTYSWNTGASTASITVSPTTSTSYTVTGTINSCSATAVGAVVVNNCNIPVADFSASPTVMCEAGCTSFTDLSTNSPTGWTWLFPGATPSSATVQNPTNICYSANGSYDVTLIASNASGSDTLTKPGYITIGAPVTVNITGNLLITSCEQTTLTAVPGDGTYDWGPSGTLSSTSGVSVTASPPSTQQYYVTYTSPDGCTDSDTTTVVVEDINTYFLPTGFTPNGDGVNDEIHLHGRGIDYFTLKIFDRIGEKVFESSDLEKGWDGKLHGLPMNDGVFVYTLDITFCNGDKVKKHGDITMVK